MQERVSILAVCSACFVVWLFLCKLQVLIHNLISDARPNELLSAHLKLPLLLKDKSFCVFGGKKKVNLVTIGVCGLGNQPILNGMVNSSNLVE